VDPLDKNEIISRVNASRLRSRERDWTIDLFIQPIGLRAKSRRWVDGRHRVEAMRRAGVVECVMQVLS
jgi:hypothetical protein